MMGIVFACKVMDVINIGNGDVEPNPIFYVPMLPSIDNEVPQPDIFGWIDFMPLFSLQLRNGMVPGFRHWLLILGQDIHFV